MVKVIQYKNDLVNERKQDSRVGFVPTMGNLHEGHLSLLERALSENDTVYFSIFVNPKQFGPQEDFTKYPRTLEKDIELIESKSEKFPQSKIVIFAPKNMDEVFQKEVNEVVSVSTLNEILEGKMRPGHFDGVTTVVKSLFDLIRPSNAYFGLKDYQQYIIIKQMVKDLSLPIKILGMPIVRDSSGLALSSRNQYLSDEQKTHSLILYNTLNELKDIINSSKDNVGRAKNHIESLLHDKNWNYLEIRDSETLSSDIIQSKSIVILAVYQVGTTRLLDNIQVEIK